MWRLVRRLHRRFASMVSPLTAANDLEANDLRLTKRRPIHEQSLCLGRDSRHHARRNHRRRPARLLHEARRTTWANFGRVTACSPWCGASSALQHFFLACWPWASLFTACSFGLSWGNLSLVVPASASLTFVANAVAARIFLHERVSRRRWLAAILVGAAWP